MDSVTDTAGGCTAIPGSGWPTQVSFPIPWRSIRISPIMALADRVAEGLLADLELTPMKLTGGEIVVRALEDEGIRFTFGIPGTHNIELYDALADSEGVRLDPRHRRAECGLHGRRTLAARRDPSGA